MTDLRKAAEMALEALHNIDQSNNDDAIEALRQALAQPEQEPVAWADKMGAVIPHSHKLFQPDLLKDYTRPLYTAPPKREWVGLTVEEARKFYEKYTNRAELIYVIDKFLEEKNNG
jgi:hypothetical protein